MLVKLLVAARFLLRKVILKVILPLDNDSFTDYDSVTDSDEDEIPSLDVLVLSDPLQVFIILHLDK